MAQLALAESHQASWTAWRCRPQPRDGEGRAGGASRMGLGGASLRREAGSALTSCRPEDAQVLSCCSSKSVSPRTQGRSWFLPSVGLAGLEGGRGHWRLDSTEGQSLHSN